MPTPVRNRFVHLDFEVDLQEWSEWAIQAGIRPEVIAFLRFRPALLIDSNKDACVSLSPRSWEFVSRILDALDSASNQAIEHELIVGAVGLGAATELTGFLRMFRALPDVDTILLSPQRAPVPEEPSAQYAVASALSRCASDTNFDRICAYLDQLPTEFRVLCVHGCYLSGACTALNRRLCKIRRRKPQCNRVALSSAVYRP